MHLLLFPELLEFSGALGAQRDFTCNLPIGAQNTVDVALFAGFAIASAHLALVHRKLLHL
jgi:hypothetical protein